MRTPNLDPTQLSALTSDRVGLTGPAGTGKTAVCRARWLAHANEFGPHRTLLLVGSAQVARDLRDALPWELETSASLDVAVHSWPRFCSWIVTHYWRLCGFTAPPRIISGSEARSAISEVIADSDQKIWGRHSTQRNNLTFAGSVEQLYRESARHTVPPSQIEGMDVESVLTACAEGLGRRNLVHFAHLAARVNAALDGSEELSSRLLGRFSSVIVDDAQTLDPAQVELIGRIGAARFMAAVSTTGPHSGADLFGAFGLERVELLTVYRTGAAGIAPLARLSGFELKAEGDGGRVSYGRFSSEAAEGDAAANELLSRRRAGVEWSEMAVLAPRSSMFAVVRRTLEAARIPHAVGARPLNTEPLVRWVNQVFARPPKDSNPREADSRLSGILTSPLVGAPVHEVRELARRAFSVGKYLHETITDEFPEYLKLDSIATDPVPADEAFGRLWRESDWARSITARRETDADAARQVRVMTALAGALRRWVAANPSGTYADWLSAQGHTEPVAIPQPPGSHVELLTIREATGREWDSVCVIGMNEGTLPDLRRATPVFDAWPATGSAIDGERDLAELALSRFRSTLFVSSASGTNRLQPSRFVGAAFGAEIAEDGGAGPAVELTHRLRRLLYEPEVEESRRRAAAVALALHTATDPDEWWWQNDFTDGEPLTDGKLVTSYSRIGIYDDCPLRYVLQSVLGLDPTATFHMKFGSLMHKIFEDADPVKDEIPDFETAKRLFNAAYQEGHNLDYPNRTYAKVFWSIGQKMLQRWFTYERERPGLESVAVEYSFNDLEVDGHIIRGRIDRISRGPQGLVLTDYKTANSLPPQPQVAQSLQLAIYYQAAKTYDDLKAFGEPHLMELVFPAHEEADRDTGVRRLKRRVQRPRDAEANLERLRDALEGAAAEEFTPSESADCSWCRVKNLCPRWPQGREIPS